MDYLQVFNSPTDYKLFNPQSGEQGQPANLLLWEYNSGALSWTSPAVTTPASPSR